MILIQLIKDGDNIKSVYIVKLEDGTYYFKLEELLQKKNISINKLMNDTSTDYKVIKRLISGDLTKLDIFVLARMCKYFKCRITDIVDFKAK